MSNVLNLVRDGLAPGTSGGTTTVIKEHFLKYGKENKSNEDVYFCLSDLSPSRKSNFSTEDGSPGVRFSLQTATSLIPEYLCY